MKRPAALFFTGALLVALMAGTAAAATPAATTKLGRPNGTGGNDHVEGWGTDDLLYDGVGRNAFNLLA